MSLRLLGCFAIVQALAAGSRGPIVFAEAQVQTNLAAYVSGAAPLSKEQQVKPALTSEVDANFSQFWSTRAYASANPPVSPVVNAWQKLNVSAPLRAAYSSSAQNAFLLTQDSLLVVTQQTPAANETSSIVNVHKVSPVDDGATSVLTPISDGVVVVSANGEMLVCHCTPAACSESITCARRTVAISNASAAAFAAGSPEQIWIGHSSGVTVVNMTSGAATKLGITTAAVTSISLLGKYAVVATDEAVFDFDGETWHHTLIGGVIDGPPTATAILPNRTNPTSGSPLAVIGDAYCLHFLNFHTGLVQRVSSMEGLPYGNVTALNAATNGDRLWVGTTWGLVLLDVVALFQSEGSSRTSAWRYFAGPRWLPDDQVVSVVGDTRSLSTESLAPQLLVVTSSGIALLSTTTLTLADKAVHYQAMTAPRHDRYGYVARVALTNFGDLESFDRVDGDNDGSWTSYYMSSQIYRYMATKDPAAKESAWHAFRAVEFLHNVTGQAGFIARTLVKCGEPHQGPDSPVNGWHNSTQCYDGYDDNAPGATDGCCWTWKGDTSTDETDGHFYGLALAHDSLAETDAERARIARLICAMTSYIVDNKFMYVDVTGYNTTWGYWAPDVLNGIPGKPNERGLNSLEILSYLGTSMHVCTSDMPHPANTTFASALAWLVRQHGYGRNLVNVRLTAPNGIAFFDFGNAFYTYLNMHSHAPWTAPEKSRDSSSKRFKDQEPPLTKDEMEVLKGQFYQGLEAYWSEGSLSAAAEHDALWSTIYSVITGKPGVSDPYWALRRWPMELIWWPAKNSHRLDVSLRKDWQRICQQNVSVLPIAPDESPDDHPDDDSTFEVDGGNGLAEQSPTSFLLAHWMARAYGLLALQE